MSLKIILIISLIGAILLGVFGGKVIGRYLRKRNENKGYEILSSKQKIISFVSVIIGVVLIIAATVVIPRQSVNTGEDESVNGVQDESVSMDKESESDVLSSNSGGSGGSVSMNPRTVEAITIG